MTLVHQYNTNGSHRIARLDSSGFLQEGGDWVGYNNIATKIVGGITYIALTDYFAGHLEPNVIYQLSRTNFKSEAKLVK